MQWKPGLSVPKEVRRQAWFRRTKSESKVHERWFRVQAKEQKTMTVGAWIHCLEL